MPSGSFVLWGTIYPLPKVLKGGDFSVPVCSWDGYSALGPALVPLGTCTWWRLWSRESHTLLKTPINLQLLRLFFKVETGTLCISCSPICDLGRLFSCANTKPQSTASVSLSLVSPQMGIPLLHVHAVLCPPIHIHSPLSCQAISLHLWRLFCHFSDRFPGCSKCSDFNTAVFEEQEQSWSPYSLTSSRNFPINLIIIYYSFVF